MLYLASDHAGYRLKEIAKQFLDFLETEYTDLGTDNDETPVDYPDYAKKLVKKMNGKKDRGILFCGTGSGMCIMANRYKGIRAVVGNNEHEVLLGRSHNDVNVLCLGGRLTGENAAKKMIKIFLDTPFSGEARHKRRIKKLDLK
ncbi:MAG TPA: ribose 5-phosphate isomerase B [Patescibacteria group bacterium]|nr:ribose 5-phosphate isomerase B [Patescibacteria group bacterium]